MNKETVKMEKSSNIELITAIGNDCEYICQLLCQLEQTSYNYELFQEHYLVNLSNQDIEYLIITYNHEKCGFISIHSQLLLHHNSKIAEIQEFIIEDKYRNKGIGKAVILLVKEKCLKNNVSQLEVCTNLKRTETQRLYRSNSLIESHYKYTMKF